LHFFTGREEFTNSSGKKPLFQVWYHEDSPKEPIRSRLLRSVSQGGGKVLADRGLAEGFQG
jgi:hypothetical protein